MWYVIRKDELYHHGILGQKWGKRNGPPYPLDASDHSASEKKAGWRKSLDSDGEGPYNKNQKKSSNKASSKRKGLSDKQKKALKIGAAVTATALVAVGGYALYKSGKLDELVNAGKTKADTLFGDTLDFGQEPFLRLLNAPTDSASGAFKHLTNKEPLTDTIANVNPNRGDPVYKNNCSYCGVAAILRRYKDLDVEAKDSGGKMQNLLGVVENCFKNFQKREGVGIHPEFAKSPESAAKMLIRYFGENAEGVCGVDWKKGGGHVFNWIINNGNVTFYDAQKNRNDSDCRSMYWELMSSNGNLQLARLDNAEIIEEGIKEIVKNSQIKRK